MTWDPLNHNLPSRSKEKCSSAGADYRRSWEARRFKVNNVETLQQKFLHLHYKEHVISINGGRGNLFNEQLKVTFGWEETHCLVWLGETGDGWQALDRVMFVDCEPFRDVDTDNIYQVGEKVRRTRDVSSRLWELSVSSKSKFTAFHRLRSKYKIRERIQYHLCQLPPPSDSCMWYNDGSAASVWIFNMVISFYLQLCIANNTEPVRNV